jgi:hypothetical protein
MSQSPGKYDQECRDLLARTNAGACMVLILGGQRGEGFSLAVDGARMPPACVTEALPGMLRALARLLEQGQMSEATN